MSNALDAFKRIDKLSKELKVFQDLLKAKLTTSLEDEAAPEQEASRAPVPETQKPADKKLKPTGSMPQIPEGFKATYELPSDLHEIAYHSRYYDHDNKKFTNQEMKDAVNNYHDEHNAFRARAPGSSQRNVQVAANKIRAVHDQNLSADTAREGSEKLAANKKKYFDELVNHFFNERLEAVKSGKPTSQLSAKAQQYLDAMFSPSEMELKAREAEDKTIRGYTEEKKSITDRPGWSFRMIDTGEYAPRLMEHPSKKKLYPSQTAHVAYHNGNQVGRVLFNHYPDPEKKESIHIPDDGWDITDPDFLDRKNEIRGALVSHIKRNDSMHHDNTGFESQIKNFIKDQEEKEKEKQSGLRVDKRVPRMGEKFTPEEIEQQRQIASEEGLPVRTKADKKREGFSPKAPMTGFSREQAEKDYPGVFKEPTAPTKYEVSAGTKKLKEDFKQEFLKQLKSKAKNVSAAEIFNDLLDKHIKERALKPEDFSEQSTELRRAARESQEERKAKKQVEKQAEQKEKDVESKMYGAGQSYAANSPETWLGGEEEQPQESKSQTGEDHIKNALNSPDKFVRDSIVDKLLQSDNVDHLEYLLDHSDPNISRKAQKKLIDLARAAKVKSA